LSKNLRKTVDFETKNGKNFESKREKVIILFSILRAEICISDKEELLTDLKLSNFWAIFRKSDQCAV
jgi:hypothetical protein